VFELNPDAGGVARRRSSPPPGNINPTSTLIIDVHIGAIASTSISVGQ
jgi:hypothetical protein